MRWSIGKRSQIVIIFTIQWHIKQDIFIQQSKAETKPMHLVFFREMCASCQDQHMKSLLLSA